MNIQIPLLKRASKMMENTFSTESFLFNNQKLINKKMYFVSFVSFSRLIDPSVVKNTMQQSIREYVFKVYI